MANRTALITGGASGIGTVTAQILAEKGHNIIINYRKSRDKAQQLVEYLEKNYSIQAMAIQGDIAFYSDCQKMYKEILSAFTHVDILIHNAGPYIRERKKMTNYEIEEWNYLINGNLNAVFYLSKLFLPLMRKQKWGRIITLGFDRVETAPAWVERSAFAAAKTGLASLTKTLSREEAENGITVNMVSPGDIEAFWKEKRIAEAEHIVDDETPIGRPGTGEDIARVIAFLCDDQSDFITGAIIPVTGGKDVLGKMKYRKNG